MAVTWRSLLLAIAQALVAAAAAFAPGAGQQAGCRGRHAILVAGIADRILHADLFFVPALVALAVGGAKLWREQPWPWSRRVVDVSLPVQEPAGGTGNVYPLTNADCGSFLIEAGMPEDV